MASRAHAAAARRGWATRRSRSGATTAKASLSDLSRENSGSPYEAGANFTRRTISWRAPSASPNHAILGNLTTLRNRSRAAVRNNGYPKGTIDKLVTNIIGTGVKPLFKATDLAIRRQLQDAWTQWTDESDADGLLDFYGQQAQATRGWLEGGEIFARLRPRRLEDGLSVPLQIQIIEPELCPHTHNLTLANGNRVRAGIEFNRIGKRVAYYFHPSRPGDLFDYDPGVLHRIPADRVLHIFDPLRAGQIRGVPLLTQSLIRFHELDKFDDAVLLRQQIANLFAGFITKTAPESDDAALHPLTGKSRTNEGEDPVLGMEPGTLQELEDGEEVTFSDPPEVRQGYKDFMTYNLRAACTSNGVPYELLTGDMSGLNDRVMRVILNEFVGRIEATQHQIIAFQFCRRVHLEWMSSVFLSGAVPLPDDYLVNPQPYTAVKFTPPRKRYIHPVQDVEAQEKAILAGFTSRSAVVSEYGEDAEVVDAEQAADNERADRLGLEYSSDAREVEDTTLVQQ